MLRILLGRDLTVFLAVERRAGVRKEKLLGFDHLLRAGAGLGLSGGLFGEVLRVQHAHQVTERVILGGNAQQYGGPLVDLKVLLALAVDLVRRHYNVSGLELLLSQLLPGVLGRVLVWSGRVVANYIATVLSVPGGCWVIVLATARRNRVVFGLERSRPWGARLVFRLDRHVSGGILVVVVVLLGVRLLISLVV